jgi:hypothetical protein
MPEGFTLTGPEAGRKMESRRTVTDSFRRQAASLVGEIGSYATGMAAWLVTFPPPGVSFWGYWP